MAFERRLAGATRRAIESAAAEVHAAAFGDPQLQQAREGLRRAVALGQLEGPHSPPHGHPALLAALAAIAAASAAEFGQPPARQQLAAALGMYGNMAVELGPAGERPLAVALCAILQVWSGRQCHVVGASDYLVARDAAHLAGLYARCACSVAVLDADTPEHALPSRYAGDVLYATGRQLLSDALRDQLLAGTAVGPWRRGMQGQGGAAVAIVDDIEAVLADEAGSPVVISAAGNLAIMNQATEAARLLADELEAGRDYALLREPAWRVQLSEAGAARVQARIHTLPVYWRQPQRRDDLVCAALLARDALEPERHYQVRDGRVLLADDSVFRLLAGRVWHYGVLQAVEAREGLPLSTPPRTVARGTLQSFFPRYRLLAGAAACLGGLERELRRCYGLRILPLDGARGIPARRYGFADAQAKLDAFAGLVAELHRDGGAVLVSAPRTADLAAIGRQLKAMELPFQLADGRDPAADALTLAAASGSGSITLVTGPAVRNVQPPREGGYSGLHALLFEHWDAARNDQRFFAWGTQAVVFGGADDDLLQRALPQWTRRLCSLAPAATMPAMVALAQWHSGRSSSRYRQSLALRDKQLDEQLAFARPG